MLFCAHVLKLLIVVYTSLAMCVRKIPFAWSRTFDVDQGGASLRDGVCVVQEAL